MPFHQAGSTHQSLTSEPVFKMIFHTHDIYTLKELLLHLSSLARVLAGGFFRVDHTNKDEQS